jgi:hypothetical protein
LDTLERKQQQCLGLLHEIAPALERHRQRDASPFLELADLEEAHRGHGQPNPAGSCAIADAARTASQPARRAARTEKPNPPEVDADRPISEPARSPCADDTALSIVSWHERRKPASHTTDTGDLGGWICTVLVRSDLAHAPMRATPRLTDRRLKAAGSAPAEAG